MDSDFRQNVITRPQLGNDMKYVESSEMFAKECILYFRVDKEEERWKTVECYECNYDRNEYDYNYAT